MSHLGRELIGSWRLLSWINRGAEGSSMPMGPEPEGSIVMTSDLRMSVVISRRGRELFETPDPFGGNAGEKARGFSSSTAYCGYYQVLSEREIAWFIEVATFPNFAGQTQRRLYRVEGSILTLSAPEMLLEGSVKTPELVWERAPEVKHGASS